MVGGYVGHSVFLSYIVPLASTPGVTSLLLTGVQLGTGHFTANFLKTMNIF